VKSAIKNMMLIMYTFVMAPVKNTSGARL
jgi:hypothetical protein